MKIEKKIQQAIKKYNRLKKEGAPLMELKRTKVIMGGTPFSLVLVLLLDKNPIITKSDTDLFLTRLTIEEDFGTLYKEFYKEVKEVIKNLLAEDLSEVILTRFKTKIDIEVDAFNEFFSPAKIDMEHITSNDFSIKFILNHNNHWATFNRYIHDFRKRDNLEEILEEIRKEVYQEIKKELKK